MTDITIRAEVLSIAREAATLERKGAALDIRRTTVLLDYFLANGLATVRPDVTVGPVSDPAHYVLIDASIKSLPWAIIGKVFATHSKGKGFVLASESGTVVPAVNVPAEKRDALTDAEREAWSSAHAWRKASQRLAATLAPTVTTHGESSQTQGSETPAAPEAPIVSEDPNGTPDPAVTDEQAPALGTEGAPDAPNGSNVGVEGPRMTPALRARAIREAGEADAAAILARMIREVRENGFRPDPALGALCAEYAKMSGVIGPRVAVRTPADA